MITFSIIPVLLMFVAERYTLYKLIRRPNSIQWVQSRFWLHPNFISRCRFPMGVVSVILYHTGTILSPETPLSFWHHAGVLCFAFWMISDITDGTIARHFDLHTVEGESIDPLSDKLLILPPLLYFSFLGIIPILTVIIFILFDTVGTLSRYFIQNKAANLFGKSKTFLAAFTLVLITMQQMYYPGNTWTIIQVTLTASVFLSFFSMFFKVIPNYWYANLISICNLTCGLIGILLVAIFSQSPVGFQFPENFQYLEHILLNQYLELAFALVFLGQFLDMFDGRAADKWGSTPKGEMLDDLADATNFGGTISLIIWAAFYKETAGAILAVIHFVCTTFRLYRFIVNKRKAGIDGGVRIFKGLPSPAAALASGCVVFLPINEFMKGGFIIVISLLMISKIEYIHFGRVILPSIPKLVKVVFLTLIILVVWLGLLPGNKINLFVTVFSSIVAYLIFGYNWRFYKTFFKSN